MFALDFALYLSYFVVFCHNCYTISFVIGKMAVVKNVTIDYSHKRFMMTMLCKVTLGVLKGASKLNVLLLFKLKKTHNEQSI